MDLDELLCRLRAEAQRMPSPPEPAPMAWLAHVPYGNHARPVQWWAAHAPLGPAWLCLPTPDLITAAYWLWLGRTPDSAGAKHAESSLANGMPKLEWLLRLRLSPEAVARLGWPWWRRLASLWLRLQTMARQRPRRWQWGALRRAERWLQHRGQRSNTLLWWKGQEAWQQREAQLQRQLNQLASSAPSSPNGLQQAETEAFLSAMEHSFRGDPAALTSQLAHDYGEQVCALARALHGPCLDVGCGRGLWLEWLNTQGIAAQGVDSNPNVVAQAQAAGLNVFCQDGLLWLQEQPDASAAVVTAFHVVEHLSLAQRLLLVKEAFRVLKPGGLLILETPNPENIWVSTHTFYHDPTHTQPLTPDGLTFLCTYHGFSVPQVLRLHPYPDNARLPEVDAVTSRLNNMTCCGQDLAVLAYKPLAGVGKIAQ